jgi:hypothetical protein
MTAFFTISDNSLDSRGFPWIDRIVGGVVQCNAPLCGECGLSPSRIITGDLEVILEQNDACRWPDALGCGAASLFVVSDRALEAWRDDGVGELPVGGRISFRAPIPTRLQNVKPPAYFWVDGDKIMGAKMDFDASGFVGVLFCRACGNRIIDVSATYDSQHSGVRPYVFLPNTWTGANLFTTDLSSAKFFCTQTVMECARQHQHTNFRFIPVVSGVGSWSKGIDYLGKPWPPHHPLRPSEGKSLDQWLDQLRVPSERYEARIALLDLGLEAVPAIPALTRLLHDNDEGVRREAALLFSALQKLGVPLGSEGEAAARQHDEWFQKTLGR